MSTLAKFVCYDENSIQHIDRAMIQALGITTFRRQQLTLEVLDGNLGTCHVS